MDKKRRRAMTFLTKVAASVTQKIASKPILAEIAVIISFLIGVAYILLGAIPLMIASSRGATLQTLLAHRPAWILIAIGTAICGITFILAVSRTKIQASPSIRKDERGITFQAVVITAVTVTAAIVASLTLMSVAGNASDEIPEAAIGEPNCERWETYDMELAATSSGGEDSANGITSSAVGCRRVCHVDYSSLGEDYVTFERVTRISSDSSRETFDNIWNIEWRALDRRVAEGDINIYQELKRLPPIRVNDSNLFYSTEDNPIPLTAALAPNGEPLQVRAYSGTPKSRVAAFNGNFSAVIKSASNAEVDNRTRTVEIIIPNGFDIQVLGNRCTLQSRAEI